MLVRLYVELLPEQVGKVQDPLVDLKRLVGLLSSRGNLRLLQQPYKTRSDVSLTCSSKKDELKTGSCKEKVQVRPELQTG